MNSTSTNIKIHPAWLKQYEKEQQRKRLNLLKMTFPQVKCALLELYKDEYE